ncbi:mitochondrial Rho GTPase 1-like [Oppia nitens]|uniref:mitochondrial Rho GTPase 1-like n=1 Tax=Oppia nitens TaxID=1686743 RepID=UPI0023DC6811|nr:mitochondrial Rho GTPase 1-like [Oppia nitens]
MVNLSAEMVSENGKKWCRILLVGEAGVGKTSLIFSLVSEEFPEDVPPKAEEITIPADVTPERISTQIVDYSAQEQPHDVLVEEIRKANVICVVYAVDDDETIDKITSYWLPLIRDELGEEHSTPVVLVGNKADLVDYSSLDVVLPVMNQFCEVETCVECSAKSLKNISELFYYAQKAVLHPTAPLYSPDDRDLTENCKKGLTRIFKLCDLDNDGVLNDHELNRFQRRCFDSPLQPQALEDVKNIVKRSIPDGVFDDGLTLSGFLFLHTLFIQRGRHETTWTVLRKYGYNDVVQLSEQYLRPKVDVPLGCSTELTSQGYDFLRKLFLKYDKDNDGALSPNELQNVFSVCERLPVWVNEDISGIVECNDKGWVTLQGFLAIWTLITAIDVSQTFEYFAYFGYISPPEENQLSSVYVTRDKRIDLQKKQTSRNIFSCHLVGPQGAGKTSFMKGFLGKSLQQTKANTSLNNKISLYSNYVVNTIQIYGQQKYLIIREIDIFTLNDRLSEPELICDVACLMYDSTDPKSFEFIARTFLKCFMNTKLPILVVAAKSDELAVRQQYTLQPDEFCGKYKLPPPHYFSVNKEELLKEVYVKLATMAAYPNLRRLVHVLLMRPTQSWVSQQIDTLQSCLPDTNALMKAGVGLATLTIVGLYIIRLMKATNSGQR